MKKILFAMALFVGMSFASCGNKAAVATDADSTEVATDSLVVDTLVVDTVAVDTVA